jgi:hypothetical protein
MPPMTSDIEGGGKWGNRADCVLVVHRMAQHPTDWLFTELHVRKTKEMETGGRPTPIADPIRMESMRGNVGFKIDGYNLLDAPTPVQITLNTEDAPF